MRQPEQVNTSSAMTSSQKLATDKSVQKVTGTSGDLRYEFLTKTPFVGKEAVFLLFVYNFE